MKLVNLTNNEVIQLHGIYWSNEEALTGFAESEEYSASGSLIINQQAKLNGEKMLWIGADDMNWIGLLTLRKLRQWNRTMGLTLRVELDLPADTRKFEVSFDNSGGTAIQTKPVIDAPSVSENEQHHLQQLNLRIHKEIT